MTRVLYSPVFDVPFRYEKIKDKEIDMKKGAHDYVILDTEHNRKIFKEVGIHSEELIGYHASNQNVLSIIRNNVEALSFLRRD
jgi:hypothetical protein